MFWLIIAFLIAAFIIFIVWRIFKAILHVVIIAVVLAVGLVLLGFHEIHIPKGIVNHEHTVLATLEHHASTAYHRIYH